MKALVQRVEEAAVEVEGEIVGRIGRGFLLFLCAEPGDGAEEVEKLARKTARLRIFEDARGKMNLALSDVGGAVLVVSQFTLAADIRRGNRPSFTGSAPPELGERLYRNFCAALRARDLPVETGIFGARMKVRLINDGPVTIWMDSARL